MTPQPAAVAATRRACRATERHRMSIERINEPPFRLRLLPGDLRRVRASRQPRCRRDGVVNACWHILPERMWNFPGTIKRARRISLWFPIAGLGQEGAVRAAGWHMCRRRSCAGNFGRADSCRTAAVISLTGPREIAFSNRRASDRYACLVGLRTFFVPFRHPWPGMSRRAMTTGTSKKFAGCVCPGPGL